MGAAARRRLHALRVLVMSQLLLLLLLLPSPSHSFLITQPPRGVTTCTMNAQPPYLKQVRSRRRNDDASGDMARDQHLSWASFVAAAAAAVVLVAPPTPAQARQQPLGVIDELLAECPKEKACASSQDDRPPVFQEPWMYDDSTNEKAMKKLRTYVESLPGAEVITAEERYLRLQFTDAKSGAQDVCEFFFTPNDSIIQFRSARLGENANDGGANLKRMEKIRIALGFEKIPVLRNRKRALFFLESPLDGWGPSYREDAPSPEDLEQAYKDNDPLAPEWESPSPYPRPPPRK